MNLSRLTKSNRFYILCLLTALLATACSQSAEPESILVQIPATDSTPEPVVAYGSYLSEWEEATQADSSSVNTSETVEFGGDPVQENPQTTASSDSDSEPKNATSASEVAEIPMTPTLFTLNDVVYQEIMWDALVPADFTADAIMAKYEGQLDQISDGSLEAIDLYAEMQAEFDNAPVNDTMDGSMIRLAGFIAPLEYTDDLITEFLLAPYFGACIHVPPPPANQTVLVKLSEGEGIKFEDTWLPFWVMGELTAEGATTELAEAGYYIENALIEPYSDSP